MKTPLIVTIINILKVSKEKAQLIRRVLVTNDAEFLYSFKSVREYNQKYNSLLYDKLYVLNEILDGYGIEYIKQERYVNAYWQCNRILFINMGDTYINTIIYDTEKQLFKCTSWGDYVEHLEKTGEKIS